MSEAHRLLGSLWPAPILTRNGTQPCVFCGRPSATLAHPGRREARLDAPGICRACAAWALLALQADAEETGETP